ncbi:MAG: VOC family protein [Hyphomicrobiaceae bacterium]|nr:VOC family protein [Hyphomicrobiaceae bacterium]
MGLRIDYVEFDSADIGASTAFFRKAFGWGFVDYGPEYQGFADAGLDGGIDGSGSGAPGKALVILKADDLEAALAAVTGAGGDVVRPIYSFPGGRRFHFREPGGNELAVWSEN